LANESAYGSQLDLESPWIPRRADAEQIRVVTYTLRSLVAYYRRGGRILPAGTPLIRCPLPSQGMCSGTRDARTRAFKLHLALGMRPIKPRLTGQAGQIVDLIVEGRWVVTAMRRRWATEVSTIS
jgi:hypothetical protein